MAFDASSQTITAWRRENGRVGVRNHVLILPVDDISNAACESVANNVKGTIAIPHAYGRLQFGEDLDLHFRTMIGTGSMAPSPGTANHRQDAAATKTREKKASHGFRRPVWSAIEPMTGETRAITRPA